MSIHFPPTAAEIAALPASDALQVHDLYDASAGDQEASFAPLIEHCTACGQPLPEATA